MSAAVANAFVVSLPELIDLTVNSNELNTPLLNILLHILVGQMRSFDGIRVQITATSAEAATAIVAQKRPPTPASGNPMQIFDVATSDNSNTQQLDLKNCQLTAQLAKPPAPIKTLIVVEQPLRSSHPLTSKPPTDIVEASMPDTRQLIRSAVTGDEKPLVKMLELLNLTKRIEAVELSIAKLSTLIGRLQTNADATGAVATGAAVAGGKTAAQYFEELGDHVADISAQQEAQIADIRNQMLTFHTRFGSTLLDMERQHDHPINTIDKADDPTDGTTMQMLLNRLEAIENRHSNQQSSPDPNHDAQRDISDFHQLRHIVSDHDASIATLQYHHEITDYQIKQLQDANIAVEQHVERLQQLICRLQNDAAKLTATVEGMCTYAEETQTALLDIAERIEELRSDVTGLNTDVNLLVQERRDRSRQIAALIEQLEQIKCIKADRETVEQMVIVKADIIDMRTKVSFAHFDDVRRDLKAGVVQALERVDESDAGWQCRCDAMQRALNEKVERCEATALERMLGQKVAAIAEKLQRVLEIGEMLDAAVKVKHEQCIVFPGVERMAAFGRVSKPCVLKMAAPSQRNCGGEHTQTVAEERTSRKGNFLEQTGGWPLGPNRMRSVAGTDGVMYRVDDAQCDCPREASVTTKLCASCAGQKK